MDKRILDFASKENDINFVFTPHTPIHMGMPDFTKRDEHPPMATRLLMPEEEKSNCPIVIPFDYGMDVEQNELEEVSLVEELPSVKNLRMAISKCGNSIRAWMIKNEIYEKVSEHITDKKLLAESFYQRVQNCVYHTLRDFCGVIASEGNDILPEVNEGLFCLPTLRFLDNFINNKSVLGNSDRGLADAKERYVEIYGEGDGIQPEWIQLLKDRISLKFTGPKNTPQLHEDGIDVICKAIQDEWCSPKKDEELVNLLKGVLPTDSLTAEEMEEYSDDEYDESEELDDETDDEREGVYPIKVNVSNDVTTGVDIITIYNNSDWPFCNMIPFQVNLTELASTPLEHVPSLVDDRNGIWDWIIHVSRPVFTFTTDNPEFYLSRNFDLEQPDIKQLIVGRHNDLYVIGAYVVDEDLGRVEEGDEGLAKHINSLVGKYIAGTPMSFLHTVQNLNFSLPEEESEMITAAAIRQQLDEEEVEEEEMEEVTPEDVPQMQLTREEMLEIFQQSGITPPPIDIEATEVTTEDVDNTNSEEDSSDEIIDEGTDSVEETEEEPEEELGFEEEDDFVYKVRRKNKLEY